MKLTKSIFISILSEIRGEFTAQSVTDMIIDKYDAIYQARLEKKGCAEEAIKSIRTQVNTDIGLTAKGGKFHDDLIEENLKLLSGDKRGTFVMISSVDEEDVIESEVETNEEEEEQQFNRTVVIKNAEAKMTRKDLNRIKMQKAVASSINDIMKWKNSDFSLEWDHAKALADKGAHSPENGQLISRQMNRTKNSKSMKRMTYKRQCDYINNNVEFYINDRFMDEDDADIMRINVEAQLKLLEIYY